MQQGARPDEDLEQLWRRIVFYICVSNVDDHLRNHGFILQHQMVGYYHLLLILILLLVVTD